jgi:hypothetical protein
VSHYAQLDKNNVVVFVIHAKSDDKENEFTESTSQVWKQTSYNTRGGVHYNPETGKPSDDQTKALRYNYAGIGFTYDETKGTDGAFIPPKPFDSWELDEATCLWEAPIEYPEDGASYSWNEGAGDWVEVTDG